MFSKFDQLLIEKPQMCVANILLNYFPLFPESIRGCCYCCLLLFRFLFFSCDSFFHCHFHNCHTKTRSENQYGGRGRLSTTLVQLDTLIIMFRGVQGSLSFQERFIIWFTALTPNSLVWTSIRSFVSVCGYRPCKEHEAKLSSNAPDLNLAGSWFNPYPANVDNMASSYQC